jgi:hypothetical protein
MAEILASASYVRNPKAAQDRAEQDAILASIGERAELEMDAAVQVWELLETPQTIATICRSIGAQSDAGSAQVGSLLAELYDQDLIQVSPDT